MIGLTQLSPPKPTQGLTTMDLFADSDDEGGVATLAQTSTNLSSSTPNIAPVKRSAQDDVAVEGEGDSEGSVKKARVDSDNEKSPATKAKLKAAGNAVLTRCKIFIKQLAGETAIELRSEVKREDLAQKLEDARDALLKGDIDECLEKADQVQQASWNAMVSDRSVAHRCWKEAYVLARTMMSAAYLVNGDEKRSVENADLAFILGAPKQEVNLIFRLVAPLAPEVDTTEVKGIMLPNRTAVEAMGFDIKELCERLSPGAKIEPLQGDAEILENPSLETLSKACLPGDNGRGVHIKGMVDSWPALEEWCKLEFFMAKYGNRQVPVEFGSRLETMKEKVVSMSEFLTKSIAPRCKPDAGECENVAYLAQHKLLEQFPDLLRMAPMPNFCTYQGADCEASSVWFGTDQTVTLLHYDSYDNFLIQVTGAKYVVLFNGDQFEEIYVTKGGKGGDAFLSQGNTSAVDVGNPDLEKFPKYANAVGKCVLLMPGDSLYIPQGMWHYVRSLTPSLSVNFWFSR